MFLLRDVTSCDHEKSGCLVVMPQVSTCLEDGDDLRRSTDGTGPILEVYTAAPTLRDLGGLSFLELNGSSKKKT